MQTYHHASRQATLTAMKQFMKKPSAEGYLKPGDRRIVLGDFNTDLVSPRGKQEHQTAQSIKLMNLVPINSDPAYPTFYRDFKYPNGQMQYNTQASLIDFCCTTQQVKQQVNVVETLRVPVVAPDHAMVRVEFLDEAYRKRTKWQHTRNKTVRAPKQYFTESNKQWAEWLSLFAGLKPLSAPMQDELNALQLADPLQRFDWLLSAISHTIFSSQNVEMVI